MREFENISPTAKMVAYLRTFTDIPFAKEIAAKSNAEQSFEEQTGKDAKSMVRAAPIWEARYTVTDKVIKEHGITQVLEVAAGLSPRGLSMTRNPAVVYVATDLPKMLEEEKEITQSILAGSNEIRANLHFQAANALDIESLSKAASYFEKGKPVVIITEGLLPYFTMEEKHTLAQNIHKILFEYSGCWITTEVYSKELLKNMSQSAGEVVQNRIKQDQYNIFSGNNVFNTDGEILGFFEDEGFKIERIPHLSVFDELSSVKNLALSEAEVLKMKQILNIKDTLVLTLSQ